MMTHGRRKHSIKIKKTNVKFKKVRDRASRREGDSRR